ncbi:NAD(P)H:quinone oxidoreductase [Sulfodiicoccus acidiphilus]|nr:NAD(P)H:quinone oxidoreductase [Sulfodiicoccus acidiphilus]
MVKVLVLFYGYGSIVELAKEVYRGAQESGAEVRLRRARETMPPELVEKMRIPLDSVKDIPEATLDDLVWADGIVMGSPTRFGNMAGPLKTFLDQTGPLFGKGALVGKAVGFFTEANTMHGGHETTVLTMSTFAYHHGMVIVPVGYAIPEVGSTTAGGSPYGASHLSSLKELDEKERVIARFLGRRVAEVARKLSSP